MFQTFLFRGYSISISNYLKRITLFDLTHMMSMTNIVAIGMKILRIDSECYLEKVFIELISMNP